MEHKMRKNQKKKKSQWQKTEWDTHNTATNHNKRVEEEMHLQQNTFAEQAGFLGSHDKVVCSILVVDNVFTLPAPPFAKL